MTALILIVLKLWLASTAVVVAWCAWRSLDFRAVAIPGSLVLMLCDAIRGLV